MSAADLGRDAHALLAAAIAQRQALVVELLVSRDRDLLTADLGAGRGAPLHWAIASGADAVVSVLLRLADAEALALVQTPLEPNYANCLVHAVKRQREAMVAAMAERIALAPLIDDELLRAACRSPNIMASLIRKVISEVIFFFLFFLFFLFFFFFSFFFLFFFFFFFLFFLFELRLIQNLKKKKQICSIMNVKLKLNEINKMITMKKKTMILMPTLTIKLIKMKKLIKMQKKMKKLLRRNLRQRFLLFQNVGICLICNWLVFVFHQMLSM